MAIAINSGKIPVDNRYFVGFNMPTADRRIETALSPTSYAVVAEAAQHLGLSIRGFTAMAAYERALSVVETSRRVQAQPKGDLSSEDLAMIEKFLDDHPGWADKHVKSAHAHTAGMKLRRLSPKEQL